MDNRDAHLEAYKQAFETLRHYSSLRFTLLTAFIVISGGLFTVALRSTQLKLQFILPSIAGFVIAIAFGVNELRINRILEFYANKIVQLGEKMDPNSTAFDTPPRSAFWKWCTPFLMLMIYGGSILMWIAAWIIIGRGSY